MQLFLFLSLFNKKYNIQETLFNSSNNIILELTATFTIIFLLLFSKELLRLKNNHPYINHLFSFLLFLSYIDILLTLIYNDNLLYEYLDRIYFITIVFFTSIYLSFKAQKEAILYSLGWAVILMPLLLIKFNLVDLRESFIYAIGFPLESILFSCALGYKLKRMIKEKELLLIQQNKLASMGEMLNNIAHQWRQPLTNLSFINMDVELTVQKNEINNNYINEILKDSNYQIDFMSQTLNNFKGFYLPNKNKLNFECSDAIRSAIGILNPSLLNTNININFEVKQEINLLSYENEYIQVILNILSNAKDALIEKKIEEPIIKIILDMDKNKKSVLTIIDNAGGIKNEVINKIFDPYFSTKATNSGIGLYMSKIIVDSHLKGIIEVKNHQSGVFFKITI
jgi:signal transduction histidine kinase